MRYTVPTRAPSPHTRARVPRAASIPLRKAASCSIGLTSVTGPGDRGSVHQTVSHDAYVKFIEDDFLGGRRLDPRTDRRPDPRPDVRENARKLAISSDAGLSTVFAKRSVLRRL